MKKVIILTGPTGIGKSQLSLAIAKRFNLDIINGDAFQVYKNINIATAKLSLKERENIPHLMMDILEVSDTFSICDYQNKVRKIIAENDISFIVGGSGLYLDAVVYDYRFNDSKRLPDTFYSNQTNEELWQELNELDPEQAIKIPMQNRKRVIRALELIKSPISNEERNQKKRILYDTLYLVMESDREELYKKINGRVDEMFKEGIIEEVQSNYHNFSQTSRQAIGVKEIIRYLDNEITKEETIDLIKKNTRHYAKRQMTWYRNHPDITRISNITPFIEIESLIQKFITDEK